MRSESARSVTYEQNYDRLSRVFIDSGFPLAYLLVNIGCPVSSRNP